jgi:signal transduction histidine kinase/ActR/RegA family two-component response regulator
LALGRREPPRPTETPIQEIREVSAALAAAAEQLSRGEAERDELLRKERLAREAAEAADRAKDEFMALLSHELRTPLNAVFGWARLLQSGEVRGEALTARALDAIVRNSDAQVQLIDDLLDLSRITAGKLRLDVRLVELAKVLQGALDAVRPAADAKAIRLRTELDPEAGPVTGDPARLQQVVWNLLMNAVKFTPAGGEVTLRLFRMDSQVRIEVSDTGQGIEPEMLPLVFERFRQADSSSTRMHGGLGLGLALVKHLVELHGGTVAAQSAGSGKGASFVVQLPVATLETPVGPLGGAPIGPPPVAPLPRIVRLDGVRVLVADDDRDAVAVAEAILAGAGAEVRSCLGAAEVPELVRRWRPDVLVSDLEMPGEDGYSLIQRVRALAPEEGGRTPAVALTAYGRRQDRRRALAAGYSMHVPKPVDPGEFTAIIAGIVAGQAP